MAQIMCDITLDVSVNDGGQRMIAKQGDSKSRLLRVHFTDQKKPLLIEDWASVLLNVSNGIDAHSFLGDVVDGAAVFTIPDFALFQVGTASCDVSVLGGDGEKLTTARFEICVLESVCPSNDLGDGESGNLAAELLARDHIQPLWPTVADGIATLAPDVDRRYAVDLSDADYRPEGVWMPLRLELPIPQNILQEHWILICCHAPVDQTAGAVVVDWGATENRLFENGEIPYITMGDFDIICTYSPIVKKWMIGVTQYGSCEGSV